MPEREQYSVNEDIHQQTRRCSLAYILRNPLTYVALTLMGVSLALPSFVPSAHVESPITPIATATLQPYGNVNMIGIYPEQSGRIVNTCDLGQLTPAPMQEGYFSPIKSDC